MTPAVFVKALSATILPNVFNPYAHVCPVHDRADAAVLRRRNLRSYLQAAQNLGVDTVWMGRDLGYRGGRRTGLALTDEAHLHSMSDVYPGSESTRTTRGPAVKERTAAEIWAVLGLLNVPPLLWNVFPYHPHEPDQPFTNRCFTARELQAVDDLNAELLKWLGIKRVISIGQDAARYALKFGVDVLCVRHPSYGGVIEFRHGMGDVYKLNMQNLRSRAVRQSIF